MTSKLSTAELHARYERALEKFYNGSETNAVLLCNHISRSMAYAFADEAEGHPRFFFIKESPIVDDAAVNADDIGSLYFRWDRTAIHEVVMHQVASTVMFWLWPVSSRALALLLGFGGQLSFGGGPRVQLPSGFFEPDRSLLVYRRRLPKSILTLVLEVAHIRSRRDLEADMARWVYPTGPARLVLGIDIERTANPQPDTLPRIEVLLQRRGEPRPSVVAPCGAGSDCTTYSMYDSTLYLPVDELLYGVPYVLRLAVKVQLAMMVPLVAVLWGGGCAVLSVLRGRRSVLGVVGGFVRSLWGPWWGVVPLDLYTVRDAVYLGQLVRPSPGCS